MSERTFKLTVKFVCFDIKHSRTRFSAPLQHHTTRVLMLDTPLCPNNHLFKLSYTYIHTYNNNTTEKINWVEGWKAGDAIIVFYYGTDSLSFWRLFGLSIWLCVATQTYKTYIHTSVRCFVSFACFIIYWVKKKAATTNN